MSARPDADRVADFLSRATRRHAAGIVTHSVAVALGLTVALPIGAALGLLPRLPAIALGAFLAIGVAVLRARARHRGRAAAALEVERSAPECRNLLVTSEQLLRGTARSSAPVRAVVLHDTAQVVETLDLSRLLPWRQPLAVAVAIALVWLVASMTSWTVPATLQRLMIADASTAPAIDGIEITLTPPVYTSLPAAALHDPDRIEPLAGSVVRVSVRTGAAAVVLETPWASQPLAQSAGGRFEGEFTATSDGYLAVQPAAADGRAGPRRIIGLVVRSDRPPSPRVTAPARDLFLPNSNRRIAVSVEAEDDLALRSLRLTFTKVSGSGESFAFTEGESPLALTRANGRAWKGQGELALESLGLSRGDMLVYRAVATDARPGGVAVESDAFIVEIVSPDAAITEGFSIDDTRDKYALSQQMVILKTERLLAKAGSLPKDALIDQAMNIAAEQRAVRAEIVFMMGGEFEDEVVEAERETELTEGRMVNDGRADLGRAVRAMSRASTQLTSADLKAALATERLALAAMQRAFTRSRYILRTLTVRERVDDARRLTGSLAGTSRAVRAPADAALSPRVALLRQALSTLAAIVNRRDAGPADAASVGGLAERLLKSEPQAAAIVEMAAHLTRAADALARGRSADARPAIARAATVGSKLISAELADAQPSGPGPALGRLNGALADALTRGGRR